MDISQIELLFILALNNRLAFLLAILVCPGSSYYRTVSYTYLGTLSFHHSNLLRLYPPTFQSPWPKAIRYYSNSLLLPSYPR